MDIICNDILDLCLIFLGDESDLQNIKKVNKRLHKFVSAQKHVLKLKINYYTKYLLNFKFNNLQILDCTHTQLTEIPNIAGLRELNCAYNQLTEIPNIAGLKWLNCSRKQLSVIPNIVENI